MFLSVSWCAETMTRLCKLKVKVIGFCGVGFGCPLDCCLVEMYTLFVWYEIRHITFPILIHWTSSSIPRHKVNVGLWVLPSSVCPLFLRVIPSVTLSCLLHISWILWTIFIELHSYVPLSEAVCRTHDSATQTQDQGHSSRSWYLPFNLWPLHISWTLWMILIKLYPNVPLSEMVCRNHDSALQTQGQGHTSR